MPSVKQHPPRENKRLPTPIDHAVGAQIRSLRRAAGMTLKDLGQAIGVSWVQFQRYETGASRVTASRLFAISDALGVRVDSLNVDPGMSNLPPATHTRQYESAELIRVFNTISDPHHRLAIIALAHAIAAAARPQGQEPSSAPSVQAGFDADADRPS